jgi:hypothetical protein
MTYGWDACVDDTFDAIGHRRASFQFNGIRRGFGHEPSRVTNGCLHGGLVAHVGHISNDERGRRATSHGL